MRQCVAGRANNFSMLAEPEAQDECRNAIESMKQSPLYDCKCRRGMKKEKNCLRIFWSIYQSLQGEQIQLNRMKNDHALITPFFSQKCITLLL